ncbi:MAG: carboxypeptidase regulatory-like domain-containing protein [Vicinamibacterales bacterium]
MTRRLTSFALLLVALAGHLLAAADLTGRVATGSVPVPGATVVISREGREHTTSTDLDGVFRFTAIDDGSWSLKVEMPGFAPAAQDVVVPVNGEPPVIALNLMSLDEMTKGTARTGTVAATTLPTALGNPGTAAAAPAFRRAEVRTTGAAPPPRPAAAEDAPAEGMGAADGLLVNGSVNNGAASPFAQLRAFGNNRPGQRSLYNGSFGVFGRTSAWDTRPYSFGGLPTAKPDYTNIHLVGNLGGPLEIPGIQTNRPTFFLGIQRTVNTTATTQSALVPTTLERAGDFSQSVDGSGRPVTVLDPRIGQPFANGTIPADRLSPQAAALLGYYPTANVDGAGRTNYQAPVVSQLTQENIQLRLTQPINRNNQLFGNVSYQRTTTASRDLFRFEDETRQSGLDAVVNWNHRFSQMLSLRMRYQFTGQTTRTTPYFANRTNVSGDAGITGNNQAPGNWGPPRLTFASGIVALSDALPAHTANLTHTAAAESSWFRGRHAMTFGGEVRRHHININAQEDPRGAFAFTGAVTGFDVADFLLGIPSTSSIASGNPDKFLRGSSYAAYFSDDWRVSPVLTVNAGVRWEYEAPLSERFGRLANLNIAPGFTSATPVQGSLLQPDRRGIQPRIGLSWRPVPGSSLLVRAGYGIYRNTNVYQPIVTALAQQPPLSTTFFAENTPGTPLTLANGFVARQAATLNTYAVDPNFRVGSAHNWQGSIRRDLPFSLTATLTYLGTKGTHLPQMFLPNTYAPGAVNRCPTCPSGFVYVTSNATSLRNALQAQVRRRLRSGFTATVDYTLAKGTDNSAGVSGATVMGGSIAQNWLDLEAERSRSAFDQRHLLTAQIEYTTGVGISGGGLMSGLAGALWKGWTISSTITAGSGLPLTPLVLVPIRGTGVVGTLRADRTGAADTAPTGTYLNPAAYAAPQAGQWGTAGRNSVSGPRQFQLNASLTRTFPYGKRLLLDWRLDATNLLNRVTYSAVNTIVGSPQFGLPVRANTMRQIQTSLRLRF